MSIPVGRRRRAAAAAAPYLRADHVGVNYVSPNACTGTYTRTNVKYCIYTYYKGVTFNNFFFFIFDLFTTGNVFLTHANVCELNCLFISFLLLLNLRPAVPFDASIIDGV